MAKKRRRRRRTKPQRGKVGGASRKMKISRLPTYNFIRDFTIPVDFDTADFAMIRLDSATTAGAGLLNPWRLSDLPDFADFQSLFGGVKLNAVSCKFYTDTNQATGSVDNNSQVNLTTLYDPFSTLDQSPTQAQLDQFQAKRVQPLINSNGKPAKLYFKPVTRSYISSGSAPTALAARINAGDNKSYVPTADGSNVNHFGPAIIVSTINGTDLSTQNFNLKIRVRYYMSFKSVR